jgi:hypothetical protein
MKTKEIEKKENPLPEYPVDSIRENEKEELKTVKLDGIEWNLAPFHYVCKKGETKSTHPKLGWVITRGK